MVGVAEVSWKVSYNIGQNTVQVLGHPPSMLAVGLLFRVYFHSYIAYVHICLTGLDAHFSFGKRDNPEFTARTP